MLYAITRIERIFLQQTSNEKAASTCLPRTLTGGIWKTFSKTLTVLNCQPAAEIRSCGFIVLCFPSFCSRSGNFRQYSAELSGACADLLKSSSQHYANAFPALSAQLERFSITFHKKQVQQAFSIQSKCHSESYHSRAEQQLKNKENGPEIPKDRKDLPHPEKRKIRFPHSTSYSWEI